MFRTAKRVLQPRRAALRHLAASVVFALLSFVAATAGCTTDELSCDFIVEADRAVRAVSLETRMKGTTKTFIPTARDAWPSALTFICEGDNGTITVRAFDIDASHVLIELASQAKRGMTVGLRGIGRIEEIKRVDSGHEKLIEGWKQNADGMILQLAPSEKQMQYKLKVSY